MIENNRQPEFEQRLRDHRGILVNVAAVYARHADDRDDLMQEIAFQLWRSYPRFDPALAKFSTWMYWVALNVAISHARRQYETAGDLALEDGPGAWQADDGMSAESLVQLAQLHQLISALDPLDRALILLYLEDRERREIAAILGLGESNVSTKINRIKQRLQLQVNQGKPQGE